MLRENGATLIERMAPLLAFRENKLCRTICTPTNLFSRNIPSFFALFCCIKGRNEKIGLYGGFFQSVWQHLKQSMQIKKSAPTKVDAPKNA